MYYRDYGVPISSSRPGFDDGTSLVGESDLGSEPAPGDQVASLDPLPFDSVPVGLPVIHQCLVTEIVDADQGFVLLLNADHVCVHASAGIRTTFGCAPEDVVGTRPEAALESDQLPAVWRTRAAIAAGARQVLTRLRWRGEDGQERWLDTVSSLIRDPATGARYTVVRGWDVTHELELQAELTRSEQRHASLLDAIDQAVLQLDETGRIASFNRQALALLERAPDEILSRPGFVTLDLRDAAGRVVTDPAHPSLAPGHGVRREDAWCTVAGPDGQRRLVLARLTSYSGSRASDAGHLLILRQACGSHTSTPTMPSREQARAAAGLTAREGDVLDGLAAGGDVPTIARWLGISVHSVRGHVKSITAKLGVHSQLQAVIIASRRGMVDLSEEGSALLGGI